MVPLALSHLLVRWLHVLGVAVAVGGAVLAWAVVRRAPDADAALTVAATYEWAAWAALGTLVMTGVGNLGAFTPTLPRGRWGTTLALKLLLVVAILLLSAVRTAVVVACRRRPAPAATALERAYAATALSLVAVVALGEVLAHG
ncbi:MAG: hypothetical protein ABEJ78_01360 [Haloferacaceae archaeon]